MKYIELGPYELVMWLLYIALGAFLLYLYKSFFEDKKLEFLLPGYFLKIIGGLIFALIYVFYYRGTGDTIEYFYGSKQLADFFWGHPSFYMDLMWADSEQAQVLLKARHEFIRFSLTEEEWFMIKLISPLNIMGLRSYLGITYFMSAISFLGSYKMYQLMRDIMGGRNKNILFVLNFLIPSVLFWGSGVLKDTITLSSFSFATFILYSILIKGKIKPVYFVGLLVFGFIILKLKAYILICFSLWILITLFFVFMKKSSNPILKFLLLPYITAIIVGVGYFGLQLLLTSSADYRQEIILKKIEGFQQYHSTLGGSAYSLGEVEYTPFGLLKKLPEAINVTLFRPYIWESNTVLVLINSLESLFLLIFFLYTVFRYKISFFKHLRDNPFLIGGVIFCLVFSFFIGISSYNFGALSRFKIPIVSTLYFIIYYVFKTKEAEKLKEIEAKKAHA
ncbi:MAG: hypothetical protein K0R65_32 [Crocinitomicaceae bacterium]|jgi:hypothetical protein|nr:hypothetical protein [Crocinitomicaceae bacterium]